MSENMNQTYVQRNNLSQRLTAAAARLGINCAFENRVGSADIEEAFYHACTELEEEAASLVQVMRESLPIGFMSGADDLSDQQIVAEAALEALLIPRWQALVEKWEIELPRIYLR